MRRSSLCSVALTWTMLAGCGGAVTANGSVAPVDELDSAPADAGVEAPPPLPAALTDVLTVSEVAVFQATKATVMKDGAKVATPNAPVIAARPGLVRVYVTPEVGWKGRELFAELHLVVAGAEIATLTDKKTVRKASIDSDLTTTFGFDLSAGQLAPSTSYFVTIHAKDGDATAPTGVLRYPGAGADDLGVMTGAETIRIQIVPVKYDADASGRLPDTSPEQLELYRSTLFRMYPTAKVEVTVHAPLPWSTPIQADGTGWDVFLQGLIDLRASDGVRDDVYYVGAMKPASTLGKFCGHGCVLGVAPQLGPTSVAERVAAIIGYNGDESANTLLQELAHAMGRGHAPCGGAGGPDKKFPYADGGIGVWGWDVESKVLVSPDDYSDIMGYCQPGWVSDYTFAGLFKRIVAVNKAAGAKSAKSRHKYRPLHVAGDGSVRWRAPVMMEAPASEADETSETSETRTVVFRDATGGAVLETTGAWHPYDNIEGGILLVEEPSVPWTSVTVVRSAP